MLLILLAWATSFTLALIPLGYSTQGEFIEKAWVKDSPFFGDILHFNDAKIYAKRLLVYSRNMSQLPLTVNQELSNVNSWLDLEKFFASYAHGSESLNIVRYFG